MKRRIREPKFGRLQLEVDRSIYVLKVQAFEAGVIFGLFGLFAAGVTWLVHAIEPGVMQQLLRVLMVICYGCAGIGALGLWTAVRDLIELRRGA